MTLRRFAFIWLFASALGGVALETAHGFKWPPYVDDELTRTLLRLAHAHGVGLSLVSIVMCTAGLPLFGEATRARALVERLLLLGMFLVPLGFGLGAIAHPEGDPNPLVLIVPVGAACTVTALGVLAARAWFIRE